MSIKASLPSLMLAALLPCVSVAQDSPEPDAAAQDTPLVHVKDSRAVVTQSASLQAPPITLHTFGRVVPSATAFHDVNAYISGEVKEIYVRRGMQIRKGDPLARIYSPDFILTQKSYLALLGNQEKLAMLQEEGRLPDYLKDARANLRWWGMSVADIDALEKNGRAVESLTITAPANGIVTDVFVEPGQLINAGDKAMKQFVVVGKALARLAVTDVPLWIEGYVFPDQMELLRPGETAVEVTLPTGAAAQRTIFEVLPGVDEKTQLARFLVDLADAPKSLVLGEVVALQVHLQQGQGVWIPRQAVLHQGLDPTVYVQRGPDAFERRRVEILRMIDDWAMAKGIVGGEAVVTEGKMMLEGAYRMSAAGLTSHLGDDHHH